jgi:hypothetical protein
VKPLTASASKIVDAPADVLYSILADYQNGHASILPNSYFLLLKSQKADMANGRSFDMTYYSHGGRSELY